MESVALPGGIAVSAAVRDHVANRLANVVFEDVVILSDGQDTGSKNSTMTLLESKLKPSEGDPTGIQIHTIGIGEDADEQVLKKIANLAHGQYWKVAKPADVVKTYKQIATYY
jgi:von Willebrand factor type A domain